MVACVIPQVFHGMSTEVTVTASSVVRPKSRPSYPFSSYISRNIFPVRMMEMYWSAVTMLNKIPEPTVDATRLKVRRTKLRNTREIPAKKPLADITPPKHIAQSISHIVLNIPLIPRVATSSSSIASPVVIAVFDEQAIISPLKPPQAPSPPILATISGWKISIAIAATTVAARRPQPNSLCRSARSTARLRSLVLNNRAKNNARYELWDFSKYWA